MSTDLEQDTAIDVRHLRKRYGDLVAVADISFTVEVGEIFGILGPNGCGKTTTVECLQGLRRADGGAVSVLGLDPRTQARQLRARIGSQLQESALPERIKVREALQFFSSLVPGGDGWRAVMERWGLADLGDKPFGTLSGGQQQRLFVALAVVNAPRLVFLDEMTTGLDPAARREAWELIRELRDRGTTVVLVTHFMDEAERLCDRLAVIRDGCVVATGTPAQLVDRYTGGTEVTFTTTLDDLAFLDHVAGVERVERNGARVSVCGHGAVLARVAAALVARGEAPDDLAARRGSLEDAFLTITSGDESR